MFVKAVLWTAFFAVHFNISIMLPLLPFAQHELGLSSNESALVLGAFPAAALVGNLLLGPLIDRFGRKRMMILGAIGAAIAYLLTALARDAAMLAFGRALSGFAMPGIGAAVFAAIADYVPPEQRARTSGVVASGAPVAFLASMSIGVWSGGLLAWQVPFLLLAALVIGLAIAIATFPPTQASALATTPVSLRLYRERLLGVGMGGGTATMLGGYFCWAAAIFVFLGAYPSWLVQHALAGDGAGLIGALLFVGELGGLAGALLSGRLSALTRHPLGLCAGTAAVLALLTVAVPLMGGIAPGQAALYVAFAFGRDLMLALMLGGAMLLVPAARRGSLNAMLNATYQTGATLGGMASAWLYALHPGFGANALAAGLLLAGCGVMLRRVVRVQEAAAV
ncbi:MAG: MFS transporter [Rhodospirillales bacterium]|nr:MFS transporter [Rhodospirillales bacterium]